MNERDEFQGKPAQLFADLIDGKTNHASGAPVEVQDALQVAARLARADFSPAGSPRDELRARLLAAHSQAARRSAWGFGLSLAARAAGVLALFFALAFLFTRLVPDLLPRPAADPTLAPEPFSFWNDQLIEHAFEAPFGVLVADSNALPFPLELESIGSSPANPGRPYSLTLHYQSGDQPVLVEQAALAGPPTGEPPMKATEEVTVRGRTGWWIVFNVGSTGLYWETDEQSVLITGELPQEDLLAIAESMTVFTPEISLQQADELFAFPLLVPDPDAMSFTFERGPIVFTSGRQGPTLVQSFVLEDGRVLNLQQRDLRGEPLAAPAPAHTETTVRGLPGYLIDGASRVTLIWEENGADTALSGELTFDELQSVAGALIPLGSGASFSANPGGQIVYAPAGADAGPTLYDLDRLQTAQLGNVRGRVLGWSPSGEFLALRDEKNNLRVFNTGGIEIARNLTRSTMDAFWLPDGLITADADWLAFPTDEGGLVAIAYPSLDRVTLLPAETFQLLGDRYVTPIFVSDDGWLAWMPSAAEEIEQRSGILQAAYAVKIEPGGVTGVVQRFVVSQNLDEARYSLLGWAPGMHALLVGGGDFAANGLLYLLDLESGDLRPVSEAAALLTHESFAWHPTRPGYLALAETDVRTSSGPVRRLALIDLTAGEQIYLTGPEEVAFEPQWSPDGEHIAFAVLPDSGDDLTGRAVRVTDAVTGETVFESQPGEAADGWPRWAAGGDLLLYVRQQDGQVELRAADLSTGADGSLLESIAPVDCAQGVCNWERVIAYNPFGAQAIEPEPIAQPVETPTPDPRYSHPTGSQINLAWDAGLSQTVALDIGLFRNEGFPMKPYYVTHIVNDPAILDELTSAFDIPVTVGGVPACVSAYELTFRLGDGRAVTFGYGCGPASGALFRGVSADGALTIEGEVMITARAKELLDPLVAIAESRRQLNEVPRWVSRIEEHAWQAGPFGVEEYLVLDPGPYQPGLFEFRQIILDWVFENRAAQRSNPQYQPIEPVTIGEQVYAVEGVFDETNQIFTAVVTRDGQEIYRIPTRIPAGSGSIHGLWAWGESWVLEVDGHVIIDGVDQTEALGAEETFDWQIMGGQPFFFVQRGGVVDVSYGGEIIPLGYEQVIHNRCCEPGAFNVGKNESMAWFYALKDGIWRYVEMGLW